MLPGLPVSLFVPLRRDSRSNDNATAATVEDTSSIYTSVAKTALAAVDERLQQANWHLSAGHLGGLGASEDRLVLSVL